MTGATAVAIRMSLLASTLVGCGAVSDGIGEFIAAGARGRRANRAAQGRQRAAEADVREARRAARRTSVEVELGPGRTLIAQGMVTRDGRRQAVLFVRGVRGESRLSGCTDLSFMLDGAAPVTFPFPTYLRGTAETAEQLRAPLEPAIFLGAGEPGGATLRVCDEVHAISVSSVTALQGFARELADGPGSRN